MAGPAECILGRNWEADWTTGASDSGTEKAGIKKAALTPGCRFSFWRSPYCTVTEMALVRRVKWSETWRS